MSMRKINLSYGGGMSDMLLELGETPRLLSYYNSDDRDYIHRKCGGKQYYWSCSGASGAGYITNLKNLVKVGQYRTDTRYNWFQSPETLRIGFFMESSDDEWKVLAPKEPWHKGPVESWDQNKAPIVFLNDLYQVGRQNDRRFVIYSMLKTVNTVVQAFCSNEFRDTDEYIEFEHDKVERKLLEAGFVKKVFKKVFIDEEVEITFLKDPEICDCAVKKFHPWEFIGHSCDFIDRFAAIRDCANPLHGALEIVEPKQWKPGTACEPVCLGEYVFAGKLLGDEIVKDGIIPPGWSKPEEYGLPALPNCLVRSSGRNGDAMEMAVYINNTAELVEKAAEWRCRMKCRQLTKECWKKLSSVKYPTDYMEKDKNPVMAMILAEYGWKNDWLERELLEDKSFKFAKRARFSKFGMILNFEKIYKELRRQVIEELDREVRRTLKEFDFEPKKGDEDKNDQM